MTEEEELTGDEVLMRRMDAGLYTLQQCGLIIGNLWIVGDQGVKQRLLMLLHQQVCSAPCFALCYAMSVLCHAMFCCAVLRCAGSPYSVVLSALESKAGKQTCLWLCHELQSTSVIAARCCVVLSWYRWLLWASSKHELVAVGQATVLHKVALSVSTINYVI